MAVSETDLELLDAYLDDALEPHDSEALRSRLATEADLQAAMHQLRAERSVRQSLFTSLEPDDAQVEVFVSRVCERMDRRRQFTGILRPLRYLGGAAACVAIGFFARGLFSPGADHAGPRQPGVQVEQVATFQVTLRDEAGRVVAVQRFDSIEKAREFATDLSRWQSRTERVASGRVVLTADRF
jgi:anti-sigma factor RsiW